MKFDFFYNENENCRLEIPKSINARNYYDNLITVFLGFDSEKEDILKKYLAFEDKYAFRKKNGVLDSQTMRAKELKVGFASLNSKTIEFYEDFLDLFDENVIIYASAYSKIEYVIRQIFATYEGSLVKDLDLMNYSVIKAIAAYKPQKVLEAMYKSPEAFITELKAFLNDRINRNKADLKKNARESMTFQMILHVLDELTPPETIDYSYQMPFEGFEKMLGQINITDHSLILPENADLKTSPGLRMAEMLLGLFTKMMQALSDSLKTTSQAGTERRLLDSGWFVIDERQLDLYKKLHKVLCVNNRYWYTEETGIYSDDLIAFVSLLQYMYQFRNLSEMKSYDLAKHTEYYYGFVRNGLERHYKMLRSPDTEQ